MKKMTGAAALCAAWLCGCGAALAAQPETDTIGGPVYGLDAVIVTASREPELARDADADVSVITADEIEKNHYANVAEAVKRVPGVIVGGHGANGQSSISDNIIINGTDKVVVLVDGMRVNTNGSSLTSIDLGALGSMDNIERIEVLKGSASNLYGSDAQGGVIQIFTKKPEEDTVRTKLTLSGGSYDSENYRIYNEGRTKDGFFWTVGAQKELQGDYKDGWGRHVINHLNAESWNVKAGQDFGDDSSLVFQYNRYQSDYTRPDSGTNDTLADKGKKDNERMNLQYRSQINDRLSNQLSLYRNELQINDNYNNAGIKNYSGHTDMAIRTTGVSDQLTYAMDNQTITGGFDWYKEKLSRYQGTYVDMSGKKEFPIAGLAGKSITTTAFYIQDQWNITDRWSLTPGVRVDHNSQFGTHTSPSLSVGYDADDRTHYYASWKEFFIAPNLYQLYHNAYGNPNLDPSTGWTAEIGVSRQFSDTLSGSISFFHQHAKNMVTWISEDPNWTVGHYQNTGEMDQDGVNLSLQKKAGEHFDLNLGYSYIHADVSNSLVLGNLPKHRLTVGADYHNGGLTINLDGTGVMDRYCKAGSIMEDYASYWVWDLAADYKMDNGFTVFGRVNNIFDQFYTDIGTSYDPNESWFSAPGRNFVAGVSYEF